MSHKMAYYEAHEGTAPPRRPGTRFAIVAGTLLLVLVIWILGGQIVWFWLNVKEFGELFLRPFYFEIAGGLILSTIALVRLDFLTRRSLVGWIISVIIILARQRREITRISAEEFSFESFKLPAPTFVAWQITKVLLGTFAFFHAQFGMTLFAMFQGWQLNLHTVSALFSLPFTTPPFDPGHAQATVIPAVPALSLFIAPILGAIGARLLILTGATHLVRIFSSLGQERWRSGERFALLEALLAVGAFWSMVNAFFTTFIDFNTKLIILGLGASGVLLTAFAIVDLRRRGRLAFFARRAIFTKLGALFLIVLLAGSAMLIQSSIADPRKVEWLGPYVVQQIGVNRYLAQLDDVKEVPYSFGIEPVPPDRIDGYVTQNQDLLGVVRIWDWEAGFAKLKPEIGLIPYVDFQDSDIIRFNGTLYWSASMKPILPASVRSEDRWYAEHFVYTHVPEGFLLLNAHDGRIIQSSAFFNQRRIYYGESGLLSSTWSAFPLERARTDEIGGYFYAGKGGVDLPPPLSWIFETNFFLAYRDEAIRVMRYRDIYDRMRLLFPYFEYEFDGRPIDMFPVTDGSKTYYAMPMVVKIDTSKVPWSRGNPLMRLVGYALIDAYDGTIQIIVLGEDFFSDLFKTIYSDYVTTTIPDWLKTQIRYPEELFEWRVSMYNFYHVLDAGIFIGAREFFEVPEGLDTYYAFAQPPAFEKPEFLAILSLELRGALGKNLAGYMVVRNDYPKLGEMIFYEVPLESRIKLLGPSATLEALDRNPEFAQLKTLLRSPRIGNNIIYRIGDHDVYFIPIYTAGTGGVVAEVGVIAAVGAAFTGEYYVGLGKTPEEAFRAFLAQLAGIRQPPTTTEKDFEHRKIELIQLFQAHNLTLVAPETVNPHVSFLKGSSEYLRADQWNTTRQLVESFIKEFEGRTERILIWEDGPYIKFGALISINGVVELHYIQILMKS